MPDVQFDTYYRYDDLTRILRGYAEEHSNLVRIESIGRSHEDRDIWLLTVTRQDMADSEKPALWIDGNIHASEVSPSSACLYFIEKLVTGYGTDPQITHCLDTRVYYICPRMNPDGAEWALADQPKIIRSSTRPYPYDEEAPRGLVEEDIDGDGRMLQMRVRDPNGPWKVSSEEPRLLVRREPTDVGGEYYRVLPEGRIDGYDGALVLLKPDRERLDLNRNWPSGWHQEHEQRGAGPYPTSEPEVRAVAAFIASHPNITGAVTFHTWSGVLLRPYSDKSDDEFPAEDIWTYRKIGTKGTEITGYPNVSVYHDFLYFPKQYIRGGFDDWMYDHMGVFSWTVEIWSPQQQAGIEDFKFIEWYREHPLEDDLKLLRWSDQALGGKGFVDWRPFEHPQLGPIEIGGWDALYAFRNPPPQFLEAEVARFPAWLTWHLLISPRLELFDVQATAIGDGAYRVRLVVQNTGWLPTYVTKKAMEKKVVRDVVCEIDLPEGAELVTGEVREEIGQLEGRAYKPSAPSVWDVDPTDDRAKVEWAVRAPKGSTVRLVARHARAGTARAEVQLC